VVAAVAVGGGFAAFSYGTRVALGAAACPALQTASSQPPAALVTAADHFAQGNYDYDRGSCDHAIADHGRAIALNPQFAEAYNNRTHTYMARQN
jgi:hypothetical protein